MPGYVETFVPGFEAGDRYDASDWAVTDGGVITGGANGSVEFARELVRALGVYDEAALAEWYALFKHGRVPEQYA